MINFGIINLSMASLFFILDAIIFLFSLIKLLNDFDKKFMHVVI